MRLYGSNASPFVRKCRILVGELGLEGEVEFALAEGGPLDDPGLRAKSPLRKIPFIEMADGAVYYDSRVVAEALLTAAPAERAAALLPATGAARLEVLTRQALGDGMADAAVGVAYETRLRPAEMQWGDWLDNQWGRVLSGLDWLEAQPGLEERPAAAFDLGDCAAAALLPYLDFRFADRDWRPAHPRLAAWWDRVKARPSVAATIG